MKAIAKRLLSATIVGLLLLSLAVVILAPINAAQRRVKLNVQAGQLRTVHGHLYDFAMEHGHMPDSLTNSEFFPHLPADMQEFVQNSGVRYFPPSPTTPSEAALLQLNRNGRIVTLNAGGAAREEVELTEQ